MLDIEQICKDFDNALDIPITKKQLLTKCASNKLTNLYMSQSDEFDVLLDELERDIDMDDINATRKAIKKLSKTLTHSREHLIAVMERMSNNGKV